MTGFKISDFQDFVGKELLLAAGKRGAEICFESKIHLDGTATILIGLASLIAEKGKEK